MSSQQVIPPHIAPDADGTFDSHYYAKAAADALLATKLSVVDAASVVFAADGSITTTPANGATETVTFNPDGTITTVYGPPLNQTVTTTLHADGTITEVAS